MAFENLELSIQILGTSPSWVHTSTRIHIHLLSTEFFYTIPSQCLSSPSFPFMCLFTSCYKISHLFTSRHKGAFSFLVAFLLRRLTQPILVKKSWGKHITAPSVLLPMHDPGTSHSLGCRDWQRCGWWGAHRLGPRATMWLMKNRASCWRTTDMDTWRATEPGSFSPPGLGLFATTARLSSAVPIQTWLMKMPVLMAFTAEIRAHVFSHPSKACRVDQKGLILILSFCSSCMNTTPSCQMLTPHVR